ncbi:MAG: cobyrinate a,c-diamide synthase [Micromonosporaceae bacterium]
MTAIPRLVIAAPSSGHGKTAIAVGLLAAFAGRGLTPSGFKIGPDYVDAGYLGLASGRPGRNLDPRLQGVDRVAPLFAHGAAGTDIAVVEGTMGLYDGLSGRADVESTAQVAGLLKAPVVLVVDAGALGQSVAALVHGFRAFDELLWLGGVVLTRVASDRHEQILREALDDIGVPVLGLIRRNSLAALPNRSLGVAPVVDRSTDAVRAVRRLGSMIASSVDLDRIVALARSAPELPVKPWSAADAIAAAQRKPADATRVLATPARSEEPTKLVPTDADAPKPKPESVAPVSPAPEQPTAPGPVIAVAGGPTFGYSYQETSELLVAAGAEVAPFDPLRDEQLPEGTRGLVFGGAFPELYADELSANEQLCRAVNELAVGGAPIVAESTGLLWLVKECDGRPMCGVLNASASTTNALVLGYRDAVARASSPLVRLGATVAGHKSHRTVVNPRSGDNAAWQWRGGHPEGFVWRKMHASYLNLHWAGYPGMAKRFLTAVNVP